MNKGKCLKLYILSLLMISSISMFCMDGGDSIAVSQDCYKQYLNRPIRRIRSNIYALLGLHAVARRTSFARRCGIGAPFYIAGVLEYLTYEILGFAKNYKERNKRLLGSFCIYQENRWDNERANLKYVFKDEKQCKKEEKLRREHEKKLRLRLNKCRKQGRSVLHQKKLRSKFFGKGRSR